jgi:hypothetical protein
VKPRWDIDERGQGVADAKQFVGEVRELLGHMDEPNWVAEDPENHLLPHLRRVCDKDGSDLVLEDARAEEDGVFVVDLRWGGHDDWVWPDLWSLIGAIAESGTYVRQRKENGTLVCDVVTGMLSGDSPFAPHGHTVRLRVKSS